MDTWTGDLPCLSDPMAPSASHKAEPVVAYELTAHAAKMRRIVAETSWRALEVAKSAWRLKCSLKVHSETLPRLGQVRLSGGGLKLTILYAIITFIAKFLALVQLLLVQTVDIS